MLNLGWAVAVSSEAGAYMEAKHKAAQRKRENEEELFLSTILPLLSPEDRSKFLAEHRRLKERREDIERDERQHRERLAVESRKAAALEVAGRRSEGSFIRGLIWGRLL